MRTTSWTLAFLGLFSGVLFACPVCGLASAADNQSSYVSMSVMLSILPLGMMGGMAFWLYRKSK
jgi:hypothetical protein